MYRLFAVFLLAAPAFTTTEVNDCGPEYPTPQDVQIADCYGHNICIVEPDTVVKSTVNFVLKNIVQKAYAVVYDDGTEIFRDEDVCAQLTCPLTVGVPYTYVYEIKADPSFAPFVTGQFNLLGDGNIIQCYNKTVYITENPWSTLEISEN